MVVVESGTNVKNILATEVPGEPCAVFVYYDTTSDWSNGHGIVVKGYVEVCPI